MHNSAQCIFVTTTEGLGQWRKWVDVVVTYQWRRQPPLGSLVTHHPPNISYTNSLALHSDSILICYILPTYLHWILVALDHLQRQNRSSVEILSWASILIGFLSSFMVLFRTRDVTTLDLCVNEENVYSAAQGVD